MHAPLFDTFSAWTLGLIPALFAGRPGEVPARPLAPQREKTVRLPMESDDSPSSLFLPAGPGPHPALLLDARDRAINLRAEAHRFASIGIAAFFREMDEDRAADPVSDVVARADYLRDRLDINPFEVGALCVGEPASGWLDAIALRGAAFLIRVTVRPAGLPFPAIVRESTGSCGAPLLDVFAQSSPLEPEATRLVDAWLLRHVTIRA
jgi:hypothetical protein